MKKKEQSRQCNTPQELLRRHQAKRKEKRFAPSTLLLEIIENWKKKKRRR
jgi:hypothetical protein